MRTVFADTLYWIAVVRPADPWRAAAEHARCAVGPAVLVTTDEVLVEFLAALSGHGKTLRVKAAQMVRRILADPNVRVVPQSRDTFLQGLQLYEQRPDKDYSLTDCISMHAMRAQGVNDVLTNDRHFAQEGFRVLISQKF
ncbi:MAG: type II toxin-antitoxin system VapC family toxin [Armatimonadota bacterium]